MFTPVYKTHIRKAYAVLFEPSMYKSMKQLIIRSTSKMYLYICYILMVVFFSTVASTPTTGPVSPPSNDGRTIGIAVGVAVGATLLIIMLLIIVVVVYIVERRRRQQKYTLPFTTVYGKIYRFSFDRGTISIHVHVCICK